MNADNFVKIMLSIFSCIWTIVTLCIVPFIKAKIEKERLYQLNYYIGIAVKCAEQIYTPEQWREKKEYVMDYIMDICVNSGINITYDQLDTLVEGIVYTVKKENK